jgi:hypothetical protein
LITALEEKEYRPLFKIKVKKVLMTFNRVEDSWLQVKKKKNKKIKNKKKLNEHFGCFLQEGLDFIGLDREGKRRLLVGLEDGLLRIAFGKNINDV